MENASTQTRSAGKTRFYQRQPVVGLVSLGMLVSVSCSSAAPVHLEVATDKQELELVQVVEGLGNPWSIAFISESDWLVTERSGRLRRVVDGELLEDPVAGLPGIASVGQGGLLDVVLHPRFDTNQLVYFSASIADGGKYGTEVFRAKLNDNTLTDVEAVFKALPKYSGGRHFGSRLVFDKDEYLFVSLGDRGVRDTAQRLDEHAGSIIRLHDDGAVPVDNPFVNVAGALPEIYSYGHRNVQGMAYDAATDTVWAHEHGPQGGDELNRVLAGQNYGWPVITHGVNYGSGTQIGEGTEKPGMLQPVTYWDPSIAPSGLALVDSAKYPNWRGNLLVGALKFQLVARLEMNGFAVASEERMFAGALGRIRDIRQSPDGLLYLLTDSTDGSIYRIE